MKEAPERIWAWHFTDSKQDEVVKGVWDDKEDRGLHEYIRADTHDALAKVADELAESIDAERNTVCQDFGMQQDASSRVDLALRAYKKVRGETQ